MAISDAGQVPMTVRDATIALLRSLGMTTIFGNPGSTELSFFKHWPGDFRYILALQEASAVAMADGYAQATHNAAFVNLHSAAGVGHALGSIFTAARNQTPLVITAGQQARSILLAEPFLGAKNATEFPRPYVKWSCEPARAQDVPAAIARAYYFARQKPCGPTFVSIPADDWDVETHPVLPRQVSFEFAPDPVALQQVADALNQSERPALIAGPGVDRDGAWDSLVALAERTKAAVWVSPKSCRCSFPEDHPQFAGFLPPVRSLLMDMLAGYDVVVVLGAPIFTYHVPSEDTPFVMEGTRFFQIIDDPEATAWTPLGTCLLATLQPGLSQLLDLIVPSARPLPAPRRVPQEPVDKEPLSGAFVMRTISDLRPDDAVVVLEAPSHENDAHDYLPIRRSESFFTGASGALGYGLPAAVGLALAHPDRRVICLLGDGSCMYSVQGLWTCVQQRLPVTFVILNNQEYAALKAFSQMFDTRDFPGADLPNIDIAGLARSYGCEARRIYKAQDLVEALTQAFRCAGPMLLEIMVDTAVPQLF